MTTIRSVGRWWMPLALAVVLGAPAAVQAQDDPASGVYVSGSGAIQSRKYAEDFIGRATFDPGQHWNIAGGYAFPAGIRAEFEYSYFKNDFDELVFFTPTGDSPPEPGDGNVDGKMWMINGYFDIPTGGWLRPYVGAGGGRMKARINELSSPTFRAIPIVIDSETPWLNAFNVRAGLGIDLSSQAAILLGYRFLRGEQLLYPIPAAGITLEPNGVQTHNFEFGLKVVFGR